MSGCYYGHYGHKDYHCCDFAHCGLCRLYTIGSSVLVLPDTRKAVGIHEKEARVSEFIAHPAAEALVCLPTEDKQCRAHAVPCINGCTQGYTPTICTQWTLAIALPCGRLRIYQIPAAADKTFRSTSFFICLCRPPAYPSRARMVDNANIQKNADFARNPVVFPQNTPTGSSTLVCPLAGAFMRSQLKAVCSSFVLRLYSVFKTKKNRRTNEEQSKKKRARGKGAAKWRRSGIGRRGNKKGCPSGQP